ncbi:MAG: mechanosensitive ion channel, partial [Gammaproteobacteria bacterium]|nr:mechanosensitive ion channel [Gammaproteobacteria bacterium]
MTEQFTIDPDKVVNQFTDIALTYGPKLVAAIIVLIVGSFIIRGITKGLDRVMSKSNMDASLKPFLSGIFNMLLKVMLVISVLGMIGIEMTSFIAILGAAGLAVGMALSGTLQNFAGGVMILLFKPFKVGDFIDAQGYAGTVKEIQIFNTFLKTADNKTIIIPNGGLATGSMVNFSTEPKRRVDWTIGVSYGENLDKAKGIMRELLAADERVLKDPDVFIAVAALADSSVNFTVRAWVQAEHYWPVFFAFQENVYNTFNERGVPIPFPQMDVHVHKE